MRGLGAKPLQGKLGGSFQMVGQESLRLMMINC